MVSLPSELEFPTYVYELKEILQNVQPPDPNPSTHASRFINGLDMNEVYPHLFVGDCDAATNKRYLRHCCITHIVNAADNKGGPAPVKTGSEFYKGTGIKYLGLDFIDLPFTNAARHFETAAKFINRALSNSGKVLVHCRQGRSRSATIAISFLMIKRGYSSGSALTILRKRRDVRPNNGFLQQLAELDLQLFRRRMDRYKQRASEAGSDNEDMEFPLIVSSSESSSSSSEEEKGAENEKEESDSESEESKVSDYVLSEVESDCEEN